jgi:hypothetical protein
MPARVGGEGQQRAAGVLAVADRDGRANGGDLAEVSQDRLPIEVEDGGGPWRDGPRDDGRPHGFDVVAAIAGAGNWGIDGDDRGRVAWARFGR